MDLYALIACSAAAIVLVLSGVVSAIVYGRLFLGLGLLVLGFMLAVPDGLLACSVDPTCTV